jgi:hypothetical protein
MEGKNEFDLGCKNWFELKYYEVEGGIGKLVFMNLGEIIDEYEDNFENILIGCYEFLRKNLEKYNFDSMFDRLDIDMNFRVGI